MKAENVMKEEVISVLSSSINTKAAFVENEIIKTKISVAWQAKGYPMACVLQKTNSCF